MNLALGGSGEALKFQMRLEEAKLVTQRQDVFPWPTFLVVVRYLIVSRANV